MTILWGTGARDDFTIPSLFAKENEPIYLDGCHLGEKGNNLIAQRMFEDFAGLVGANGATAEPGVARAK
jgi:hypothetical protein